MIISFRGFLGVACMVLASPSFAQDGPAGDGRSANAPSADGSEFYVAVGGGLVLAQTVRTDAGVSARLNDGYMALAAVGGRIGPFRGEVEGSYRDASVNSATGFGLRALGTGRVSALSGMGNLYLEPSFGLDSVRPYLGGGLGVSRFRARDVGAVGIPVVGPQVSIGTVSGSKMVFAYQAMAGLSGPVSDRVTASFGYRYFATPGADLDAPIVGSVRVRGLKSHGLEAGLRFTF
jgi:opacity protein-like surface antigen